MNALPSQLRRGAVIAAALITLFAQQPEAAAASSRVCRQLEAELAGSGRTTPQANKTDAAIAKQSAQLKAAKRQARAAGCGFRIFGKGSSSCDALNAKVDGLERSVASLKQNRPTKASGRSRAQLLDALRANGCRGDETASVGGPRSLLQKIFGGGVPQRNIVEDVGPSQGRTIKQARRSTEVTTDGVRFSAPPGRYRTLCVRSCDGYYFPLSTSSRPSDFPRDQANCQTSCPGTEAQIYYTQPDGEADTMVSGITGRAYTDLPAAWLYKQIGVSAPAGCSCTAQRNGVLAQSTAPSGEQTAAVPAGSEAAAPSPLVQPRYNEERAADRRVRVVGPVFLPDPEGAADPQAPAPSEGR